MRKKINSRQRNEVNAGSMADIAFLLLIFFLVTTTILNDNGILVKLPPFEEGPPPIIEVADRNVLSVKVNKANQLLVENEEVGIQELKTLTKTFILNPDNDEALAKSPNKAVVSLQNDRETSYDTYLSVYNELKAAYRELWDEYAQKSFGKPFAQLNSTDQKTVRNAIPLVISEAEPTSF